MRIPVALTVIAAGAALVVVLLLGRMIIQPPTALLTAAGFTPDLITPNADGDADVTIFSYTLTRNADITLTLERPDGQTFIFRENEARIPGDHAVAFSGVVDGYILPDEDLGDHEILRRLIPDGAYTWRLIAVDDDGASVEQSGSLIIRDGDAPLPLMLDFTVFPRVFTPNQDSIDDRAQVNVYLSKEADLQVYLLAEDGTRIYIPERREASSSDVGNRRLYDYDGGVDNNAEPPPDGDYTMIAFARDAVGQEVQRTATISLRAGGKPRAEIVAQVTGVSVVFEPRPYDERFYSDRDAVGDPVDAPMNPDALTLTTITMPLGDMLVFMLTVENYGTVPIRTTGPEPGTVYQWDQRAASLGWFEEAGAWRVGIDCTTAPVDYPWRWGLGDDDTLEVVVDEATGNIYRYLPAGERAVVWGAIRMTEIETRNPQDCWAGLIHEQVEIAQRNRNVGVRAIELIAPADAE